MAIPRGTRTPRLEELETKLKAASAEMKEWPQPGKEDFLLIGGIVVFYGYVDFNLRRLLEAFERGGVLPKQWCGHDGKLDAEKLAKAVQETPVWKGPHDVTALRRLEEMRKIRNLVAHFAVRRFPSDDAFVFVTKNRREYKRVMGHEGEPGQALTAIVECDGMRKALKEIERIHNWLAEVTPQFEKIFKAR